MLAAIALSIGLVFLYTWIVGQDGALYKSGNSRASTFYVLSMLGVAYLIYNLVFERKWRKKK